MKRSGPLGALQPGLISPECDSITIEKGKRPEEFILIPWKEEKWVAAGADAIVGFSTGHVTIVDV